MSEIALAVRRSLVSDYSASQYQHELGGLPDELNQKYGIENIITHRFMGAPEAAVAVLEPLGLAKDLNHSIFFALKDEDAFVSHRFSLDEDISMTKVLFGLEGEQNCRFPITAWEPFDVPQKLIAAFEHIKRLGFLSEVEGQVMWNEEVEDARRWYGCGDLGSG